MSSQGGRCGAPRYEMASEQEPSTRGRQMSEQKLAVITGGGSGIGQAIALRLARADYVCLLAGRRADRLADTARLISKHGGRAIEVQADVTRYDGRLAIQSAVARSGCRLAALVNNAGASYAAGLFAQDIVRWRQIFALNVEAAAFLSFSAMPVMQAGGGGAIVNIGSVYGSVGLNSAFYSAYPAVTEQGPVRAVAYSASKGALMQVTRELALAGASMGVRVNTVSPGMIAISDRPLDEATTTQLESATPMKRLGRPAEVAEAAHFLLSEQAGFITGTELVVDGGWTAW